MGQCPPLFLGELEVSALVLSRAGFPTTHPPKTEFTFHSFKCWVFFFSVYPSVGCLHIHFLKVLPFVLSMDGIFFSFTLPRAGCLIFGSTEDWEPLFFFLCRSGCLHLCPLQSLKSLPIMVLGLKVPSLIFGGLWILTFYSSQGSVFLPSFSFFFIWLAVPLPFSTGLEGPVSILSSTRHPYLSFGHSTQSWRSPPFIFCVLEGLEISL